MNLGGLEAVDLGDAASRSFGNASEICQQLGVVRMLRSSCQLDDQFRRTLSRGAVRLEPLNQAGSKREVAL